MLHVAAASRNGTNHKEPVVSSLLISIFCVNLGELYFVTETPIASEIAEYTTVIQNVVLALCGIATVVIAYSGLTTWRKELKGKSEYAKAKEVLKAVYKVRRGFMIVRSPAIFLYEYPEHMVAEYGGLKSEFKYEGFAHVYETRWKVLSEAFQELEDQTLDAQVEWGSAFEEVIAPLRTCRIELQIAVQELLSARKDPIERQRLTPEQRTEQDRIIYNTGKDSANKFTGKINDAIRHFEEKLRPHIKK